MLSHLRAAGYHYSCSVLLPEARLGESLLSDDDACRVFRMPQCADGDGGGMRSVLHRLLAAVAEHRPTARGEMGTQTEPSDTTALEHRLQAVDRKVAAQIETGEGFASIHALEDQMRKYQREVRKHARANSHAFPLGLEPILRSFAP